jgi:hypothetical protein
MKAFLIAPGLLFISVSFSHAQVPSLSPYSGVVPAVFNTVGGSYDDSGSYFRFEWSLGELLLIQTFSSADNSIYVTQGLLQPCTDKPGPSPLTVLFDNGDYKLFPNPTAGKFELNFFVRTSGQMSLQLINASGQLLEQRNSYYNGCCRIEYFDLSRYPDGLYYVIADLKPDLPRSDGIFIVRHSGLKVVKLSK